MCVHACACVRTCVRVHVSLCGRLRCGAAGETGLPPVRFHPVSKCAPPTSAFLPCCQISLNSSRTDRQLSLRFQSGAVDVQLAVGENQRIRFPCGPLRFVMFSVNALSAFRLFSVRGTFAIKDGAAAAQRSFAWPRVPLPCVVGSLLCPT
jgi:hypothetical protein